MQLPPLLRAAADAALDGHDREQLGRAARELSRRYRAELRDGLPHIDNKIAALAYVATRLPATYAAVRAAFDAAQEMREEFTPVTMLDAGAGPGTALWAARDCWPSLKHATAVERSGAIRAYGEEFSKDLDFATVKWRADNVEAGLSDCEPHDLVTLAYVLDELEANARDTLVSRLWALTNDMLVIVEPGTSGGWSRILSARERLIATGAHILAPCPNAQACPLAPPDWCHFSRRVSRSKQHRDLKQAEVPWEDEKFIYVAASRQPGIGASARVIAPPRLASGRVNMKLCLRDGTSEWRLVSRRDGDAYKKARRLAWGDRLD